MKHHIGALFAVFFLALGSIIVPANGEEAMMKLTSSAFAHMGKIPMIYTCQGKGWSPPLAWDNLPDGTRSLALIVSDPDVPDPRAPRRTWVHWVLFDIPPRSTGLPENVSPRNLPPGTRQGLSDWRRTGYGGPCPPIGRHRYFHKLYALDVTLSGLRRPNKSKLEKAMQGHVLAVTELVGTYKKRR